MNATLIEPGSYLITESDPIWESILHDLSTQGLVLLKTQSGQSIQIEAKMQPSYTARELKAEDLPDFQARRRKIFSEGNMSMDQAALLDRLYADDRAL